MRKVERLNALRLKHLPVGLHPDGANLFLQVTSKDARSWILRYKRHGRSRDMGLGRLHDVTLVQARQAAQEARATLRAGKGPNRREARRQSPEAQNVRWRSFEEEARAFINAHRANDHTQAIPCACRTVGRCH